jgi:hypothetical protein
MTKCDESACIVLEQVMWGSEEYNETEQLAATFGGREPQLVRTAPAYDSPTTLRMWALGDMGTGQHEQALVRNVAEARMKEEGTAPAMFLALGGKWCSGSARLSKPAPLSSRTYCYTVHFGPPTSSTHSSLRPKVMHPEVHDVLRT